MRWVVVTPTFAAGLGVVVAAAMAAPTRTVVLSTGPYVGQPCAVRGCGITGGKGTLAARPGTRRLVIPAGVPTPGPGEIAVPRGAGRGVLVQYRTMRQDWNGGFAAEVILASRNGKSLGSWVLHVTYPDSRQIEAVWGGAQQLPHGQHSVTVTAAEYPQGGWSGGTHLAQIVFLVSGQARPPATCTLDGHRCHYTTFAAASG